MPRAENAEQREANGRGTLLWDMAGTLIPFDPVTGRPGVLPGCEEFLPELGRDFRLFVTTGDTTAGARGLLADYGLLPYFQEVFGDLFSPVGKPYGEILRRTGGDPRGSLAIGDRLRADLPADTADVVTLLINQDGDVQTAGMVAFVVGRLRKRSADFCAAFDGLCADASPDPECEGAAGGGRVVRALRRRDGFSYRLWIFQHQMLEGDRRIIVI